MNEIQEIEARLEAATKDGLDWCISSSDAEGTRIYTPKRRYERHSGTTVADNMHPEKAEFIAHAPVAAYYQLAEEGTN